MYQSVHYIFATIATGSFVVKSIITAIIFDASLALSERWSNGVFWVSGRVRERGESILGRNPWRRSARQTSRRRTLLQKQIITPDTPHRHPSQLWHFNCRALCPLGSHSPNTGAIKSRYSPRAYIMVLFYNKFTETANYWRNHKTIGTSPVPAPWKFTWFSAAICTEW